MCVRGEEVWSGMLGLVYGLVGRLVDKGSPSTRIYFFTYDEEVLSTSRVNRHISLSCYTRSGPSKYAREQTIP